MYIGTIMNTNIHIRPQGLFDYRSYIANESHACSLLNSIRWPLGTRCPRCNSDVIWSMEEDYRCSICKHHFSVTSGTLFEHSHLKVSQWILAIGLFKVGINALALQWAIGCSYPTARKVLRTLRQAAEKDPILQQLQGEIETDEAYYGGRQKGQRGRGGQRKYPVLGFKERTGDKLVKTVVVPNVEAKTLLEKFSVWVKRGSKIFTDGFRSYNHLSQHGYRHKPYDHTERFVSTQDPQLNTQRIENVWSHTKPIAKARYRKITLKALPGILAENDFRSNHRKDHDFIELMLKQIIRSYP